MYKFSKVLWSVTISSPHVSPANKMLIKRSTASRGIRPIQTIFLHAKPLPRLVTRYSLRSTRPKDM